MLLELEGVTKSFGPVQALQDVNLQVNRGEVHALIGENGAGKSTLMKILSGAHKADSGEMSFEGRPYEIQNPADARRCGVSMIYQELNIAPHLSVEENITLGMERSRGGVILRQQQRVVESLNALGDHGIDPKSLAGTLSLGQQQLVEIARSIFSRARLIIMDEPTSSLSAEDTKALFGVIRRLKDEGFSIIYISHFLEEVQEICDRYTVIRDGETITTGSMKNSRLDDIIQAMVGRELNEMYPQQKHDIGATVLDVQGLQGSPLPKELHLKLHKGEILGIAGLIGSGRTELLRAIFGLDPTLSGKVHCLGGSMALQGHRPRQSLQRGMDLLSENRKEEGLAVDLSLTWNITLSKLRPYLCGGWLRLGEERAQARQWCEAMGVKCHDPSQSATTLSGGNQQKVAIARMLHHNSEILLLDEPTRGIDVGSKTEIYKLIEELAQKGKAMIVVSSYLPELLGICDSLAVMYKGTLSPVRKVSEWSETDIMKFATSGPSLSHKS